MVYVWGLATIIDSSSREDKYKIAVARAILQNRAVGKSENQEGGASKVDFFVQFTRQISALTFFHPYLTDIFYQNT